MKKLGLIFSSLLAFNTLAAFEGEWKGKGRSTDTNGENIDCSFVSMKIDHSKEWLKIYNYKTVCGDSSVDYEPMQFIIKNGKIFYETTEVGSIDDKNLSFKIIDNESPITLSFEIKKVNPKHLSLKDTIEYEGYSQSMLFELDKQ